MNYTEMTDFEINKAVAEVHLNEWFENGICVARIEGSSRSIFNPCNSWADAGPIIERERITITSALRRDWWDAIDISADIEVRHVNPLRAAMIVFLMTQEKE